MLNLIQADLYKLRKSLAIKILFAITTICAAAMAVIALLIPSGQMDAGLSNIGFLFSDANIISILGGTAAGVFICGDFDNKTLHDAIANGYSRFAVMASKTAVLGIAVVLLLLPYAVVTGISLGTGSTFSMGSVAVGFLHLLTSGEGSSLPANAVPGLLAVIVTLMIVYAAQLSICVPLAFLIRKPIFVVAITYGFSILTGQLMQLSERFPGFERLFSATPYGGRYLFVTLDTAAGDIVKAIAVSLIFIAVMLGLTYSVFRKSELK